METGIGTLENTYRYILFAGGWKGIFLKALLEFPLVPTPVECRAISKRRAAFFFKNTLVTEGYPLKEEYENGTCLVLYVPEAQFMVV
jgi:hypothetical protein